MHTEEMKDIVVEVKTEPLYNWHSLSCCASISKFVHRLYLLGGYITDILYRKLKTHHFEILAEKLSEYNVQFFDSLCFFANDFGKLQMTHIILNSNCHLQYHIIQSVNAIFHRDMYSL
jgi:hypothetical protein